MATPINVNVVNSSSAPVPVTGTVQLQSPQTFYNRVTAGMGMGASSLVFHTFDAPFVIEYLHIWVAAPADCWLEIMSPGYGNPLVFPVGQSHTVDQLVKIPVSAGSTVTVRRPPVNPPDSSGLGFIGILTGTPQ